jgi:hypothetical protein
MKRIFLVLLTLLPTLLFGQETKDDAQAARQELDSLYIEEVENKYQLDKVLHAEPLFIDLIRDLGARKGEAEWNVGLGLSDRSSYDSYEMLVEYEFAPLNRLGVEFEVPITINMPNTKLFNGEVPSDRIESFKTAIQWSFYVSEKNKTSMALGYIHEFVLQDLNVLSRRRIFSGNIFNPFFIAAKRWGQNFHTLIYTGPHIERALRTKEIHSAYQWNTNFHYMLPGTRNFIGLEVNKEHYNGSFDAVLRPQMRLAIADNFLVGIVTGIPLKRGEQRLSSFIRLIYEPKHRI